MRWTLLCELPAFLTFRQKSYDLALLSISVEGYQKAYASHIMMGAQMPM